MKKMTTATIGSLFLLLIFSVYAAGADFEDFLGRRITLKADPMRIISLAPNITEMLYFLGLGDRLVGVTTFSDFPREAKRRPKVGSYTDVNVEKVITLDPDLVVATADGNKREDVAMLEQAGIPVFVINPRKVHQVLDTVEKLGIVCGVQESAERKARELRKRVMSVVSAVTKKEKPLVLLVINVKPLMSVNRKTTHHDLIRLAGGRNLAEGGPITYPKLSIEEVIRRGPEVIIISSMEQGGAYEKARKEWFQWSHLPAVQKRSVYLIDSDLIDRAAPRLVEGLEEMARLIHPEIAWDEKR